MPVPYLFETPLVEGVIEKRKSQFTMLVNYEGEVYSCHCPTTVRVGNLDLAGRPCLMSKSKDEKRKTPLQHLQLEIPDYVKTKKVTPFSSTGRMTKHVKELAGSLEEHQRAILLTCFIYDNPGFRIIERSTNYDEVKSVVDSSISKGVETWQANFKLTPTGVTLEKYFKIDIE